VLRTRAICLNGRCSPLWPFRMERTRKFSAKLRASRIPLTNVNRLDSSSEDFSYFTLKHVLRGSGGAEDRPISLFGISCTRQLDSSTLIDRPPEVTRSTVQKAVVVIADSPVYFGGLKEKLGMVTRAWFAQR